MVVGRLNGLGLPNRGVHHGVHHVVVKALFLEGAEVVPVGAGFIGMAVGGGAHDVSQDGEKGEGEGAEHVSENGKPSLLLYYCCSANEKNAPRLLCDQHFTSAS